MCGGEYCIVWPDNMGVVLQKQKSIHMNGYSVWVRRVKLQLRSTQYNYANIWNGYDIHVDVEVLYIWVCRGFRVDRFYMMRTKILVELCNKPVLNLKKSSFLVSTHIYLYSRIEYWSLLMWYNSILKSFYLLQSFTVVLLHITFDYWALFYIGVEVSYHTIPHN